MAAILLPDENLHPPTADHRADHRAASRANRRVRPLPQRGRRLHLSADGAQFEGGQSGEEGALPAPSLVVFVKGHSEADFIKTIRTGVTPEGHTLKRVHAVEDLPEIFRR